ncbi:MAG TPA: RsmB/NOP family class I SAM-dependent RNA methyltransferase [Ignavibacteriaceae bacterium]|nr:RsmB/NOP family class I SAM-dependent RNA methyltransferase [Ignavibacteriaceae bacterium]
MIDPGEKIKSYLSALFGEKNLSSFIDFINAKPFQYLRVNPLKTTPEILSKQLFERYGIETEKISEIPFALKVIQGDEIAGKTLEHILGLYYIQGLSSMIPALILAPDENNIVLDLCAAPGSKTTQLGEMMKNKGTLISNEIQLSRLKALVHNIERMNIVNAGVLHRKGELLSKVYENYFDKILVDAPCSGLGIIQKKDEVIKWWDENKVTVLADLQLRLLIAAIKMLKVGGEIVYSTCTLTAEENELIINKVLTKYPVELKEIEIPVINHKGLTSIKEASLNPDLIKGKRIFPWETGTDGFFIAKIKKVDATKSPEEISFSKKDIRFLNYNHKDLFNRIKKLVDHFSINIESFANYKFLIKGIDIFFVAENWNDYNTGIFERIGLKFGTIDKNGEIALNTQAAQLFGNEIKNSVIEFQSQEELKIYMEGGIIKTGSFKEGQHIVKFDGNVLGTAVVTQAGIKSRFPRSKRTQEIFTDF